MESLGKCQPGVRVGIRGWRWVRGEFVGSGFHFVSFKLTVGSDDHSLLKDDTAACVVEPPPPA